MPSRKNPAREAVVGKTSARESPSRKTVSAKAARVSSQVPWVGPGVRIRMYRPGLGDCFLLSFGDGTRARHVLVDCGVFVGTRGEKERLREIAADVVKTAAAGTSGHPGVMAAMVATHEHWDHVAGFFHAADIFQELPPERVWVAWTEDPDQTIARERKASHRQMAAALERAVERLAASPAAYDRECGSAIAAVMGFGGPSASTLNLGFSERSNQGMEFVTKGLGVPPAYLKPGDVMDLDWVPGGLRVYVLGPPMDRKALLQGRTPVGEGYGKSGRDGSSAAWMAGILGAADASVTLDADASERARPFDSARALPEQDVFREIDRKAAPEAELKNVKSGAANWTSKMDLFARYAREDWRRIDMDWLQSAASLALQLDGSINNTSLVLAFELVESGKVLLFVGDAELENWKSWQGLEFDLKGKEGAGRTVSVPQLLERTVFYKVGHHGSGNATLRAAFEQMTSPELVAAVPTDEAFARDKKGWEMPAAKLRPELHARARGRVLDATPGVAAIAQPEVGLLSPAEWRRFAGAVSGGDPADLFADYRIDLDSAGNSPAPSVGKGARLEGSGRGKPARKASRARVRAGRSLAKG